MNVITFSSPKKMRTSENNKKILNKEMGDMIRCESESWKSKSYEMLEILELVGKGTFGVVFKVKIKPNFQKEFTRIREHYALKEILTENEKEGFPITAIREIMLLKRIKHENIIELDDIVFSNKENKVFLVFEYMEHDLAGLIDRNIHFSIPNIKYILYSLLKGLEYLHSNHILHRDIKSSNALINNKGDIKIADFGLAKMFNPKYLTNRVVTLWYRSPELLLGSNQYDASVDIWSIGYYFNLDVCFLNY